jgi:hypothetical protein
MKAVVEGCVVAMTCVRDIAERREDIVNFQPNSPGMPMAPLSEGRDPHDWMQHPRGNWP